MPYHFQDKKKNERNLPNMSLLFYPCHLFFLLPYLFPFFLALICGVMIPQYFFAFVRRSAERENYSTYLVLLPQSTKQLSPKYERHCQVNMSFSSVSFHLLDVILNTKTVAASSEAIFQLLATNIWKGVTINILKLRLTVNYK